MSPRAVSSVQRATCWLQAGVAAADFYLQLRQQVANDSGCPINRWRRQPFTSLLLSQLLPCSCSPPCPARCPAHILCVHLRSSNCAHSRQTTATTTLVASATATATAAVHSHSHRASSVSSCASSSSSLLRTLLSSDSDFLCVPIFSLLIKINNLMIITFKVFNLQTFRRVFALLLIAPQLHCCCCCWCCYCFLCLLKWSY